MSDDITLKVGNQAISGWTEIRITRGIERLPSDFSISLTESYPGILGTVVISEGDPCQVLIGNDLIITGYVDKYIPSINAREHGIRIVGRSKCQDLVDCSAEWPNGQISGANVLSIAQKLAKPYGITVTSDGNNGPQIQQFNLILGETAYEIIERLCRVAALLAYDLPDGSLYLGRAGKARAASGFIQGQNVQDALIEYSMDQRYSVYKAYYQNMQVLGDIGNGGNLITTVEDKGVRRNRQKYIIAESGDIGNIATDRATWERNRNIARSTAVQLKADSWRDAAGNLWTPNTLVPLHLPALHLQDVTWLIGEVTYLRDKEEGSRAELLIMHPDAFKPEPFLWQPIKRDIAEAAAQLNTGK